MALWSALELQTISDCLLSREAGHGLVEVLRGGPWHSQEQEGPRECIHLPGVDQGYLVPIHRLGRLSSVSSALNMVPQTSQKTCWVGHRNRWKVKERIGDERERPGQSPELTVLGNQGSFPEQNNLPACILLLAWCVGGERYLIYMKAQRPGKQLPPVAFWSCPVSIRSFSFTWGQNDLPLERTSQS